MTYWTKCYGGLLEYNWVAGYFQTYEYSVASFWRRRYPRKTRKKP
jgi:hypothetical protein